MAKVSMDYKKFRVVFPEFRKFKRYNNNKAVSSQAVALRVKKFGVDILQRFLDLGVKPDQEYMVWGRQVVILPTKHYDLDKNPVYDTSCVKEILRWWVSDYSDVESALFYGHV